MAFEIFNEFKFYLRLEFGRDPYVRLLPIIDASEFCFFNRLKYWCHASRPRQEEMIKRLAIIHNFDHKILNDTFARRSSK